MLQHLNTLLSNNYIMQITGTNLQSANILGKKMHILSQEIALRYLEISFTNRLPLNHVFNGE